MKTRSISFSNHKGGQSKTSSTVSVGCNLSRRGYKVLLIDLDAQANLTNSLLEGNHEENLYTAMTGRSKLPILSVSETLYVVPASLELAMLDLELASAIARERILSDLLEPIKDMFDFIFLDCPPSLGILTLNAFTASTDIIVPMVAEVLPFQGLKMISNFLSTVNKRLNPKVKILGILIARFEEVKLSRMIEEKLRSQLGDMVFTTKIRKNITVAAAPLEHKDIQSFDPKSNGAKDYMAFTEELLTRLNMK